MNLAEYFFKIEKEEDTNITIGKGCDFWSVDEQSVYYYFTCRNESNSYGPYNPYDAYDTRSVIEALCDCEFERFSDEMVFVDWKNLQPLFAIYISEKSDFPKEDPVLRNQTMVIRGTCSGRCSNSIIPYDGYAARLVPCCEWICQLTKDGTKLPEGGVGLESQNLKAGKSVKVGRDVFSRKYATFVDMLIDAAVWAKYCKCVDAVIFNLDSYSNMADAAGAYAAIRIKNGQLEVVIGERLKKLYHQYGKYPPIMQ